MRTHWIVNMQDRRYVPVDDFGFDGEWKEEFPHTKGEDWLDVVAFPVWKDDRTSNGIHFVYDLTRDGGLFTLLVDRDVHDEVEVNRAEAELRHKQDVVSLRVLRLLLAKDRRGW
jgi:hypothetical protein